MRRLLPLLLLINVIALISAQKGCKAGECGSGQCQRKRCKCPEGFMGNSCARPCQDTYKACALRWKKEGRCDFGPAGRTRWYDENCADTCGQCTAIPNYRLDIPMPFLIDDLSWLVGKWEARVNSGDRFPVKMEGPYVDLLYIHPELVTLFDRPVLNFTAIATLDADKTDVHKEVGFLTSKFHNEDTGFVKPEGTNEDLVQIGLELNSNTGLNTVEEGVMEDGRIRLTSSWIKPYPGMEWAAYRSVNRTFGLNRQNSGYLEEEVVAQRNDGQIVKWLKYYWKTGDYLTPSVTP